MAEIGHAIVIYEDQSNLATGSFAVAGANTYISASALDASSEYWLLVCAQVGGNSTSNHNFEHRIAAAPATALDFSHSQVEPRRSGSSNGMPYFWQDRYTTPASPVDIEFQVRNADAPTSPVHVADTNMLALKLDDLTEGTDFKWSEDLTLYDALSATWVTSGAQVILDGGGGVEEWACFCSGHVLIDNATSHELRMRLDISGVVAQDYWAHEGEDINEEFCLGSMVIVSASASVTCTMEVALGGTTPGSNDVDCLRIFALRLSRFVGHIAGQRQTTENIATLDDWYDGGATTSKTFALAADYSWFFYGNIIVDANESTKRMHRRLRDSGRNLDLAGASQQHHCPNDAVDQISMTAFAQEISVSANVTMNILMQAEEEIDVVPVSVCQDKNLCGFTWELSAVAGDLTVAATVQALSISEQAATVNRKRNANGTAQAISIAEQAAVVNRRRTVNASTQALAISEAAAALNRTRLVAAGFQALSFTEQAATLTRGVNISAAVQALVITEYAATINRMRGVNATTQALALTELAATVTTTVGNTVSAAVQALSITTYQATINASLKLSAAVQALAITAFPATITTDPPWSGVGDASSNWAAVADATASWSCQANASTTWSPVADASDPWSAVSDAPATAWSEWVKET